MMKHSFWMLLDRRECVRHGKDCVPWLSFGKINILDVFKGSEVPGIPCTPRTFLGCFQNCLIVSKIVSKIVLIVCKIVLKLF